MHPVAIRRLGTRCSTCRAISGLSTNRASAEQKLSRLTTWGVRPGKWCVFNFNTSSIILVIILQQPKADPNNNFPKNHPNLHKLPAPLCGVLVLPFCISPSTPPLRPRRCHTQSRHTELCRTRLCHTKNCHTHAHTQQCLPHTHKAFSHTQLALSLTLSLSHVFHTQLFHTHTQHCHIHSLSHTQLCHTQPSHTNIGAHTHTTSSHATLSHAHTQLCHIQLFHTHTHPHTTLSRTHSSVRQNIVTQLCNTLQCHTHTRSCRILSHIALSHIHICHT